MSRKIEKDIKIFDAFKRALGLKNIGISHIKYGKIDIISRKLSYGYWNFGHVDDRSKNTDTLFLVCLTEDGRYIKRIYKLPTEDIGLIQSISITENPKWGGQSHEKYRICKEDEGKFIDAYNNPGQYRTVRGSYGYLKEMANKYNFSNLNEFIKWGWKNGVLKSPTDVDKEYLDNFLRVNRFRDVGEYQKYNLKKRGLSNKEYSDYLAKNKGFENSAEDARIRSWERGDTSPMEFNEECSYYLGIFMAERKVAKIILPLVLGEIIEEKHPSYPGFDFMIKDKDGILKKVDVKSRRLIGGRWQFMVCWNKNTDFFLNVGFNNEYDDDKIDVLRIWLFNKSDNVEILRGNVPHKVKYYMRDSITMTEDIGVLTIFKKYEITNVWKKLNVKIKDL